MAELEPMAQAVLSDYLMRLSDVSRAGRITPLQADGKRFPADFLANKDLRGLLFNPGDKNYFPDLRINGSNCDGANFRHCTLPRANLAGSTFRGADFLLASITYGDLTCADFTGADFSHVGFHHNDLDRTVFAGVRGLPPIPEVHELDQRMLAAVRTVGALDMDRWHGTAEDPACTTTHCRAGWTIHLAGPAGYKLEREFGTDAAAALIYNASGSHPTPDFYTNNAAAMADIEERAAARLRA